MQERVKPRKRAVNLSIDAELLEAAKAAGSNLSALLEQAVRDHLCDQQWKTWREQNRDAIEASNQELAQNGLWADRYRTW